MEENNHNNVIWTEFCQYQIFRKIDSYPPHNCHRTRGGYKLQNHSTAYQVRLLLKENRSYWEAQHYFCSNIDSPHLVWLSSMLFFLMTPHEGEAYCFRVNASFVSWVSRSLHRLNMHQKINIKVKFL